MKHDFHKELYLKGDYTFSTYFAKGLLLRRSRGNTSLPEVRAADPDGSSRSGVSIARDDNGPN